MALQDTVPLETLEKAVSTDLNNQHDLLNRQIAEVTRAILASTNVTQHPPLNPSRWVRGQVASGLIASQSAGTTIVVGPGVLAQQVPANPPSVPAPGTFDSSYRFGLQLTPALDVTDPWDATGSWWLLEARVIRYLALSEQRWIYNPVLHAFALSGAPLDKRYESRIEFRWRKDPANFATELPPFSPTWAPIAFCYRPVGGGAITDNMIGQLSYQAEDVDNGDTTDGLAKRVSMRLRRTNDADTSGIDAAVVTTTYHMNLAGTIKGTRLWARTPDAVTVDLDAAYTDPTSVAALNVAGTWGYVYLAPIYDAGGVVVGVPSACVGSDHLEQRGMLVVSRVAPTREGLNSGAITPPLPYPQTCVIPAGGAVHLGMIRSAGVWSHSYISISDKGEARIAIRQLNNNNFQENAGNNFIGPAGPTYTLATAGPGGTEDLPWGVTAVRCVWEAATADAAAVALNIQIVHCMRTGAGLGDVVTAAEYPRPFISTDVGGQHFFDLYPRSNDQDMTVTYTPLDANFADTGGGVPDGGNCTFRLCMIGFRI